MREKTDLMASNPKLPKFIIAGATRSGTTTLHLALDKNPNIFMPAQKELHFFYRDGGFAQGEDFYANYFKDASSGQICGEASPTYFTRGYAVGKNGSHIFRMEEDSAIRLSQTYPDTKIILSLRHPARRAHSFFYRTVWQGHEKTESFEQAIEEELNGTRIPEKTPICPLYLSHYKTHLEHWLSLFPRENIHILIMEEWTKSPAKTLATIENFIGAEASNLKDEDIQQSNQGRRHVHPVIAPLTQIAPRSKIMRKLTRKLFTKQGYPELSQETYNKLCDVFEDDITYIEKVLGRTIEVWRS